MGKPSIATLPPFQMVIVAFVAIIILGGLWLYDEYGDIQAEAETRAEAYISGEKALLKTIVQDAVSYARYMQSESDDAIADIQRAVLARIAQRSTEIDGYIFVGQWAGRGPQHV